jgi:alpha-glucosidase
MFMYQWGHPHDLMKELRTILKEYPGDRMLVGEDDDISYHGEGDDELNLVFNFPLMRTDRITPGWVRRNQKQRLGALAKVAPKSWPCNTLGNHDCSRIYTRYGDGLHDAELARLNLALVLTLRGTPFLYNGEEIGMTDLIIRDPSQWRDTMATWYYNSLISELKLAPLEAAQRAGAITRDKNRTPMQWTSEPNGGFCPANVPPWLPINPNYAEGINVAEQTNDPESLLNFYRRMLQIRKSTPALVDGTYHVLHPKAEKHLAFLRSNNKQSVLVVMNYSCDTLKLNFSALACTSLQTIFSSASRSQSTERRSKLQLAPYEIYLAKLTG